MKHLVLASLLLLVALPCAQAQDTQPVEVTPPEVTQAEVTPAEITQAQLDELQLLRESIQTINDLESRGSISAQNAVNERHRCLMMAATTVNPTLAGSGATITISELNELLTQKAASTDVESESKIWGYFTFINAMWAVVGLLLVVSLVWIFFAYIAPALALLPKELLELLAYLACGAFILAPEHYITGGGVFAFAIVGSIGLALAVLYSVTEHFPSATRWDKAICGIMCLAWGAVALHHDSSLIGAASVLALLWLMGSWALPFMDLLLIFDEDEIVPAAFWTSAFLLVSFTGLKVWGNDLPQFTAWLSVFQYGVFWLCGIAYSSGLLIMASRHYKWNAARYLLMQALAILSGIAALYFGSVYQIDLLREMGGSFIALYLVTKFFDIPWNIGDHWAWVLLTLAFSMYCGVSFMELHPQYFLGF